MRGCHEWLGRTAWPLLFHVDSPSDPGLVVPDFRSASRSKKSSLIVYDSSAYSTRASADQLHDDVLHKLQSGRSASFTPFDTFAEDLARSGRLRRHYTQNIDCRHTRLPFLSQRTMWLHGRADTLVCHIRPSIYRYKHGHGVSAPREAPAFTSGPLSTSRKISASLPCGSPTPDTIRRGSKGTKVVCWTMCTSGSSAATNFLRWRHDRQNTLLVKGDPGKGKTMLFFCQATDARINNATALLRGLVYMLVDRH